MRPLALELAFDSESDHRLGRVWSHLSDLYGRPSDSELGVRPHVTLALFRDEEPADLPAVGGSLASELAPFTLDLVTVDRFPGSEGVVFLRPDVSAELARLHARVQELLAEDRQLVDAYYRPGSWQPHCTMAIRVPEDRLEDVLSACHRREALGTVRVTRVQVVRYHPVTLAWEAELDGSRRGRG